MDARFFPIAQPDAEWPRQWCALCGAAGPAARRQDSRCARCASPLAPALLPSQLGADRMEVGVQGRRGALRRDQRHGALVQTDWLSPPEPMRWLDLSLTGLSFVCHREMAARRTLRVIDEALEAVAEVVACRREGPLYVVHARLLTVLFLRASGVFVSASA